MSDVPILQTVVIALRNLNPRDIETIEVLRTIATTAIYGVQGGNGVIIVTTKRGGITADMIEKDAPGVANYSPKGYYMVREFYSPQYDDPKTNANMADLRSTIFWKSSIVSDKDGKASFDFFNADSKGTYRVVIEGIDGEGNLGRQIYRYKVE
jgi:TonB-dependent SusC/RagA subfamily outer membrane receptor